MDAGIATLAVLLVLHGLLVGWGVFSIRAAIRETAYLPATSDDWYVVFDVDSGRKHVSLWFYPVVALVHRHGATVALTSQPREVEAIVLRRGAENRAAEIPLPGTASATSGNWFRGGVMIDARGAPHAPRSRDFAEIVGAYRALNFDIEYLTPVPLLFRRAIGADPLPGDS